MRFLLITEYSPFETSFGAQQRTHHLWRALAALGEVDVLLLRQGGAVQATRGDDPRFIAEATYRLLPFGWRKFAPDPSLTAAVARHVDFGRYDLICGRYLGPVSKLALPESVPVVVDLDDAGYAYAGSGSPLGRLRTRAKAFAKHALERRAMRRFRRFFFVSQRDRERFSDFAGSVLPNIPVPPASTPGPAPAGQKTILFVGALWYAPNREGVEWFLERCWPAIAETEPGAQLLLAGAAPEAVRARWSARPGVAAPGFVNDLGLTYREAALAVVPIFSGGGTNIKVLEALAHRRACVTTPFCLGGFEPFLAADRELLVAYDAESMVRHCVDLLRDTPKRERLASSGLASVSRHYSFEAFQAVVAAAIAGACRPAA